MIEAAVSTDLVSLLREAIRDRLGGVVGIVLSGGLDSSTVASLAPREVPTFTGWYNEPGFDERHYARLVAHREHHEIEITPADFVENFDAMVKHLRRPVMGMGTFGQFMVAKYLYAHGIDVAMSGEGSDELFGGYARQMLVAGEAPPAGYEDYVLPVDYPDNLHDALIYDYERLPELLAVDDQMTSAFGIEARAPFTDPRIVEYGLALPDEERIGKRHLRQRVRGIVPPEIVDRTDKMGFPAPLVVWAHREPVRSFVLGRIGYLPDRTKPWSREWWLDLVGDVPA